MEKQNELLVVGGEDWRANEWKNGEVSLWKINSAVERKGLPSTAFGSQPLDSESREEGGEHTNHGSRPCWP